MPAPPAPPASSGLPGWFRARGAGCALAVFVLLGATVTAPFSTTSAFAAGDAALFDQRNQQAFVSALSSEQVVGLDVSAIEDTSASKTSEASGSSPKAEYTLDQFISSGVVNWGGYKFTYYSQKVLPGPGLAIPGRHVNDAGYVSDADGFIVLAGSAPKGTVFETPFGAQGKIYDRGTVGNHLDVYIQ